MPKVKVNDINIYYEIKGQGEPIVLILGLAATVAENQWLIDSLAQKYKVLSFDNRGAGLTDKPDTPYSIEMMSADMTSLMKELRLNEANIIGISMGGRIALEFALTSPEKVRKLILVSTSAKVIRTWRSNLVFNFIHRLPVFRDAQPRYAFTRQLEASRLYDATGRLHEIHVPALILHGKNDTFAQYKLAREMHEGIAESTLIYFRGGHLFFMMGQRKQFIEAITEFLPIFR